MANRIPSDDSICDDDVFIESTEPNTSSSLNIKNVASENPKHPSPTGYKDYKPPSLPNRNTQQFDTLHKTILLGDSGVGKTTLLVRFNTGEFQTSNFSATVGIGFTLIIVGDSGVGKTCILLRFRDNAFLSGSFISTVGMDFRNKIVDVDGSKVKLQIWDTAGQERFRSVTHAYYRDAHALLLLYDVTNKASFDNIRAWLGEIKEYAQDDVVIMLLGNKSDCKSSERAISREDGEKLSKEHSVAFMETSAKTGLNVDLAFIAIAKELVSKHTDKPQKGSFNVQDYIKEQTNQHKACAPCT